MNPDYGTPTPGPVPGTDRITSLDLIRGVAVNRSGILLFCLVVWILQLWWSQAWLNRFRFGPAEWLWRVATYRRGQRLRRARAVTVYSTMIEPLEVLKAKLASP